MFVIFLADIFSNLPSVLTASALHCSALTSSRTLLQHQQQHALMCVMHGDICNEHNVSQQQQMTYILLFLARFDEHNNLPSYLAIFCTLSIALLLYACRNHPAFSAGSCPTSGTVPNATR